MAFIIGTAGWGIGRATGSAFTDHGSALERYASVFEAAEVNSSFRRSHRSTTWQRWRDAVPEHFRFSVKMPKAVSHERRLVDCEEPLDSFFEQVRELGDKLSILLLQLPPKLVFDAEIASAFFNALQSRTATQVVCEPRHASWFTPEAEAMLQTHAISRVAADPARHPDASNPDGWRGLNYYRLHGSPVVYRSSYADRIEDLARQLREAHTKGCLTWCIFDNTASSAAISDALLLHEILNPPASSPNVR